VGQLLGVAQKFSARPVRRRNGHVVLPEQRLVDGDGVSVHHVRQAVIPAVELTRRPGPPDELPGGQAGLGQVRLEIEQRMERPLDFAVPALREVDDVGLVPPADLDRRSTRPWITCIWNSPA